MDQKDEIQHLKNTVQKLKKDVENHNIEVPHLINSIEHLTNSLEETNKSLQEVVKMLNKQAILEERMTNIDSNMSEFARDMRVKVNLIEKMHSSNGEGCASLKIANSKKMTTTIMQWVLGLMILYAIFLTGRIEALGGSMQQEINKLDDEIDEQRLYQGNNYTKINSIEKRIDDIKGEK